MNFLIGIIEQGLIFSIVAIGVYITYKILDFPDLSVDGTFPLGGAVTALCLTKGLNPIVACVFSMAAGAIGGYITGILHVKLKITNLLSGILVMIGLYSINLRIMSKPNIPLFGNSTIFSKAIMPIIVVSVFVILIKVFMDVFLKTKLGFLLIAVGDNEQLVTSLGIDKDKIKIIGLMLSNSFVALSGSIMVQYQGFSDVGMGTGIVVMGLAAVIMGESLFKGTNLLKGTTFAIIGAIMYKAAVAGALKIGFRPTDLKLITAVIVIIALSLNNTSSIFKRNKKLVGGDNLASSTKPMQNLQ